MSMPQSELPPEPPGKGWAVAGLCLGIFLWIFGWFLFWFPPALVAIVAMGIVASSLGLRNANRLDADGRPIGRGRGMSIAGLIMNCVAAPGIALWSILVIVGVASNQ